MRSLSVEGLHGDGDEEEDGEEYDEGYDEDDDYWSQ